MFNVNLNIVSSTFLDKIYIFKNYLKHNIMNFLIVLVPYKVLQQIELTHRRNRTKNKASSKLSVKQLTVLIQNQIEIDYLN